MTLDFWVGVDETCWQLTPEADLNGQAGIVAEMVAHENLRDVVTEVVR